MKATWVAGVAAAVLAAPALADEPAGGSANLAGKYTIVGGEKYGGQSPEENLRMTRVHITADTITAYDRDDKKTYVSEYKVRRQGRGPWVIEMTSTQAPVRGQKAVGLIERDGDKLRLIYALPGGEPPTEFKTKAKQLMFTLKREGD